MASAASPFHRAIDARTSRKDRSMNLGLPLIILGLTLAEPPPTWTPVKSGTTARLRGLHAVDAKVVWASGTQGSFTTTRDGGATWTAGTVPGAEALDFRDVHAFNARSATLLASGVGAQSQVFQTDDGGKNWVRRFTCAYPSGFFDAIAFWDEARGLILGDPVGGKFQIFRTEDGGKTWHRGPLEGMPAALPNEGAFAASGTCLVVQGRQIAWFATGGAKASRVFRTTDGGEHWQASETPVAAANASSGIFSLAFRDELNGIAAGGDYKRPDARQVVCATTSDGGKTWIAADRGPSGYRSGATYVPGLLTHTWIAVGPTGASLSTDDGKSWTTLGNEGFHAVGATGFLDSTWAVGDDGNVFRLRVRPGSFPEKNDGG